MCHVLVIEDDWLIASEVARIAKLAGGSSISMAASQHDAIMGARAIPPGIILSDVQLREGTGPLAVEAIIAEQGAIPVIFMTATPENCTPCEPPHVVLQKPVDERVLTQLFKEKAPL